MEKKQSKTKRCSNNEQDLSMDDFRLLPNQRTSTRMQQYERFTDFRQDFFTNQNQFTFMNNQKRTRNDDDDDDHDQSITKRVRYEQINSHETENEPPRATIQRRSLFLCHPKSNCQHIDLNNHHHLSFNQLLPTSHSYDSNLSNYFSTSFSDPPLRTTNFVFDNKQQSYMSATTVHRTGNISPAHSDTSVESTSTCSSDEQQFHLFHYQTTRSNRERENYEQLLDLAEKLSDPDRFNQVNIEQFVSYRYKSQTSTDLTACVICMSNFKNGQRIRVLSCQHEYHAKCIARWFTMNSSCPICRRDNFFSS